MQQKKLKKELAGLWRLIKAALQENRVPETGLQKKMLRACEDYRLYTDKTWQDDWAACHYAVVKTLESAASGDLTRAWELAAEVDRLTTVCHNRHRQA